MIIQYKNFGNDNCIRCGIHAPVHDYGDHIHEYSEILYVMEGELLSTVNGVTEVVREGDMVFISPLKVHSTRTPKYCKLLIMVISNDFVYDMIDKEVLYRGFNISAFTPSPWLREYFVKKYVSGIESGVVKRTPSWDRAARACVHAIVEEFLAKAESYGGASAGDNVLSSVILYMNSHFTEQLTLSSVSRALGYSSGYISHCFEQLPNLGFSTLLSSMRVEYSKGLLLEGKLANVEVALNSGFNCERSFYRAFVRHVGMSPRQYVASRKLRHTADTDRER